MLSPPLLWTTSTSSGFPQFAGVLGEFLELLETFINSQLQVLSEQRAVNVSLVSFDHRVLKVWRRKLSVFSIRSVIHTGIV
jgi:hypothetical protein